MQQKINRKTKKKKIKTFCSGRNPKESTTFLIYTGETRGVKSISVDIINMVKIKRSFIPEMNLQSFTSTHKRVVVFFKCDISGIYLYLETCLNTENKILNILCKNLNAIIYFNVKPRAQYLGATPKAEVCLSTG